MEAVRLTDFEQKLAIALGKARQDADDKAAVRDNRHDDSRTSVEVHIAGAAAEIAFAKLTNCFPDLSTEPRRGGHDVTIASPPIDVSVRVDVKHKERMDGALYVSPKKIELGGVEVYALMLGKMPTFLFGGWIRAEDLYDPHYLVTEASGSHYKALQRDLEPDWKKIFEAF